MRKLSVLLMMALMSLPVVLAGGKYGYYGKSGWYIVIQLLACLLFVFISSVIFWWTYLWIVEDEGKLFKK